LEIATKTGGLNAIRGIWKTCANIPGWFFLPNQAAIWGHSAGLSGDETRFYGNLLEIGVFQGKSAVDGGSALPQQRDLCSGRSPFWPLDESAPTH